MVISFSYLNFNDVKEISQDHFVEPNPPKMTITTNVYFVFEDALRYEVRSIDVINNNFEEAVINELRSGPINKQYSSFFQQGIELISVDVDHNTCFINFESGIENVPFWNNYSRNIYIASLVNSLTEIDRVSNVQILINSEKVFGYVNGNSMQEPLSKMESYVYKDEDTPEQYIKVFLDNLNSRKYDLAYEMMSDKARNFMPFEEFKVNANNYNDRLHGYTREVIYTQETDENILMYVKYINLDTNADTPEQYYKDWELIREQSEWRINNLEF